MLQVRCASTALAHRDKHRDPGHFSLSLSLSPFSVECKHLSCGRCNVRWLTDRSRQTGSGRLDHGRMRPRKGRRGKGEKAEEDFSTKVSIMTGVRPSVGWDGETAEVFELRLPSPQDEHTTSSDTEDLCLDRAWTGRFCHLRSRIKDQTAASKMLLKVI